MLIEFWLNLLIVDEELLICISIYTSFYRQCLLPACPILCFEKEFSFNVSLSTWVQKLFGFLVLLPWNILSRIWKETFRALSAKAEHEGIEDTRFSWPIATDYRCELHERSNVLFSQKGFEIENCQTIKLWKTRYLV